ncbi:MAG: response regulator [Deltaproteobacteria bacterium]|nr:MAG: response regulator [Deltaproteobacteria bacterium]
MPTATADRRLRVLLAEDDEEMRSLLAWVLTREGYVVEEVPDGMALQRHLYQVLVQGVCELPDLLISDIRMPGATGLQVLSLLRERGSELPVLLITAFGDRATHQSALDMGALAVLDKPFTVPQLQSALQRLPRAS